MRGHTNTKFKEKCSNSKTKVRCVFWISETMNPAPSPWKCANDNFLKTDNDLFDILILLSVLPQCDALLPPQELHKEVTWLRKLKILLMWVEIFNMVQFKTLFTWIGPLYSSVWGYHNLEQHTASIHKVQFRCTLWMEAACYTKRR
jgi:hypothetical protein